MRQNTNPTTPLRLTRLFPTRNVDMDEPTPQPPQGNPPSNPSTDAPKTTLDVTYLCPNCKHPSTTLARACPNCPDYVHIDSALALDTHSNPALGRKIDHRFALLKPLGKGGFGSVFLAQELNQSQRLVALKLFQSGLGTSDNALGPFHRETRAVSHLHCPHTVTLHTAGFDAAYARPYIVFEYVQGRTLHHVPHEEWHWHTIAHVASQILLSLIEAHNAGIIHRDLKPDNIMLTTLNEDPFFVKVVDFGIARMSSQLTQSAEFSGTPLYASPEQISTPEDITGRCDLYSLGIILWELITGEPPFDGESALPILFQHLRNPLPTFQPLPHLTENQPPRIQAFLERALQKDPDRRFPDARTMRTALLDVFRDHLLTPTTSSASWPLASSSALSSISSTALPVPSKPIPKVHTTPPKKPWERPEQPKLIDQAPPLQNALSHTQVKTLLEPAQALSRPTTTPPNPTDDTTQPNDPPSKPPLAETASDPVPAVPRVSTHVEAVIPWEQLPVDPPTTDPTPKSTTSPKDTDPPKNTDPTPKNPTLPKDGDPPKDTAPPKPSSQTPKDPTKKPKASHTTATPTKPPSSKSKLILFAAILVVLICALGAGVLWFLYNLSDPKPSSKSPKALCNGLGFTSCLDHIGTAYAKGDTTQALIEAYASPHPVNLRRDTLRRKANVDPSWGTRKRFQCAEEPAPCDVWAFWQADTQGPDAKRATRLLEERCDQNHLDACMRLGIILEDRKDQPKKALKLYAKAYKGGLLKASAPYAFLLLALDPAENTKSAKRAAKKGCDAGYTFSCWTYGSALQANKKTKSAIKAYSKACKRGFPEACTDLAFARLNRDPKNTKDALKLLKTACDKGYMVACAQQGVLLDQQQNEWAQALKLYKHACNLGWYEGCALIPQRMKERHLPLEDSKTWLQKACDLGHTKSCKAL